MFFLYFTDLTLFKHKLYNSLNTSCFQRNRDNTQTPADHFKTKGNVKKCKSVYSRDKTMTINGVCLCLCFRFVRKEERLAFVWHWDVSFWRNMSRNWRRHQVCVSVPCEFHSFSHTHTHTIMCSSTVCIASRTFRSKCMVLCVCVCVTVSSEVRASVWLKRRHVPEWMFPEEGVV